MRIGNQIALTLLVLAIGANAALAISPETKCEADKNREAGKYAFCRLKVEAKAIKRGLTPDYSKCDSKLLDKWAKAEQKAINKGASCADTVLDTQIQSFVTAHTDAVSTALDGGVLFVCAFPASGQTTAYGADSDGDLEAGAPLSYRDNGDGTITDNNTGLMWEKKGDSGGIHDKDNTYTWCGASCGTTNEMDGTITTVFLDTLNDVAGSGTNCFADYCDWRVPNAKELQSTADYEEFNPPVAPAFHQSATCAGCSDPTLPSCSCTGPENYWSSTTNAADPSKAWILGSSFGEVGAGSKTFLRHTRAVRGGALP